MHLLKNGVVIGLCVVCVGLICVAYAQPTPTTQSVGDYRKFLRELRPYTVTSAQVNDKFLAVYVIDQEGRRLSVLKYDDTAEKLIRVGARDLGKDFNSPEGGPYAETTLQISPLRGLLFVTDNASRRIIAYKVDLNNNSVKALIPIDLSQE
jgi:hypothetical protein